MIDDTFAELAPVKRGPRTQAPYVTITAERISVNTAAGTWITGTYVRVLYSAKRRAFAVLNADTGFKVTPHKGHAFIGAGPLVEAGAPFEPKHRYAATPIDGGFLVQL